MRYLIILALFMSQSSFALCTSEQAKKSLSHLSRRTVLAGLKVYKDGTENLVKQVSTIVKLGDFKKPIANNETRSGKVELFAENFSKQKVVQGFYAYVCSCKAVSDLPAEGDLGVVSCKIDYRTPAKTTAESIGDSLTPDHTALSDLVDIIANSDPREADVVFQIANGKNILISSQIRDKHIRKVKSAGAFYRAIKQDAAVK